MRILHLTTFLQGGAGRAITELALAQQAAGYDVRVAVDSGGEPGYQNYKEYLERLAAAGVPVAMLTSTFKRDLARNIDAVAQLRSLVDVNGLDLVHAHAAIPTMVACLAASPSPRPIAIVQSMHGWGMSKSAEHSACDATLMNLVDKVVVPSQALAGKMRTLGVDCERLAVVPYGLPEDSVATIPETDARLLTDLRKRWSILLACIGTIGERKNQRLVVDALAQVRRIVAGCVFVGDGDAAGLSAYARSKGVSDRTVVLGYRPHAGRYLRRTDACVLASRSEGQPLAILEAFRDEVPVIAAGTEELSELVEHGSAGVLFEPDDAASLAGAIQEAARGRAREWAARARTRFEAVHTLDRMVGGYARIYAEAIARRTSSRALMA